MLKIERQKDRVIESVRERDGNRGGKLIFSYF